MSFYGHRADAAARAAEDALLLEFENDPAALDSLVRTLQHLRASGIDVQIRAQYCKETRPFAETVHRARDLLERRRR